MGSTYILRADADNCCTEAAVVFGLQTTKLIHGKPKMTTRALYYNNCKVWSVDQQSVDGAVLPRNVTTPTLTDWLQLLQTCSSSSSSNNLLYGTLTGDYSSDAPISSNVGRKNRGQKVALFWQIAAIFHQRWHGWSKITHHRRFAIWNTRLPTGRSCQFSQTELYRNAGLLLTFSPRKAAVMWNAASLSYDLESLVLAFTVTTK